MNLTILNKEALQKAINLRDLTNPAEGKHAIQLLMDEILEALRIAWQCEVHIYRESPIVSIQDNYDKLKYPSEGPARAARYTRYVCETALLRTSTSASVPKAMQAVASDLPADVLLACPGLVYRRDCIDRLHLGEIHQMDLWRVTSQEMGIADLEHMIATVFRIALPGMEYRIEPRVHPYTEEGLQMDVWYEGEWVEVGECGLAHPEIIQENIPQHDGLSGLAMGLGMDRLLMLRKGLKDIRLVASANPQIAEQMLDLSPYREVSLMPAVKRDLSLILPQSLDAEMIGDRVREALAEESGLIESVEMLAETAWEDLPPHVQARLGMLKSQKNTLLRVILKALDRTLTDEECNVYRDRIYAYLHEGKIWEWASELGTQGKIYARKR